MVRTPVFLIFIKRKIDVRKFCFLNFFFFYQDIKISHYLNKHYFYYVCLNRNIRTGSHLNLNTPSLIIFSVNWTDKKNNNNKIGTARPMRSGIFLFESIGTELIDLPKLQKNAKYFKRKKNYKILKKIWFQKRWVSGFFFFFFFFFFLYINLILGF